MFIYDAFTNKVGKGNRTALIDQGNLSSQEMQALAKKLGYAESLFYKDKDLRYFSPSQEIDFCGHASLAYIWHRGQEEKREEEIVTTPVGEIPIFYSYKEDELDLVWMLQAPLKTKEAPEDISQLLESLGLEEKDIDRDYPLELAYTGNWDVFIPVKSAALIDGLSPKMDSLAQINTQMGVLSSHLYTMEGGEDYQIYTRDFAPACGIDEDPVTGSANGALYGLLNERGFIDPDETLVFGQGHALGLEGRVYARLDRKTGRILVGGKAVRVDGNDY